MVDERIEKLAELLVKYSVFVKPGENVILSGGTEAEPLILEIYKQILLAGGHPILRISPKHANYLFYKHANKEQLGKYPEIYDYTIKKSQKYIGIHSEYNTKELAQCDPKKITLRSKVLRPISDLVCNNKPQMHRVSTSFPTDSLAQEADMSIQEYEEFFYNACLLDWKSLSQKMHKIAKFFKRNSEVKLIGKGINLTMKVYGDLLTICEGKENMPDGEICMAPIKETLEGYVKFDYPAIEAGKEVTDIELKFEKGKVVEAKATKNEDFLKEMIAVDENSSYVGELGIGCNPNVTRFTKDLLFDEKINGTIHLALGTSYVENSPKDKRSISAIHWDIVKDMHQAKIIVDGKIIQENGVWKL